MITDSNLELQPDWNVVTQNIGGVPPTSWGWSQTKSGINFWTLGPAYADILFAIHRPICPNSGKLSLSFNLIVDGVASVVAQALEFDTRIAIGGYNLNLSSQINYEAGGILQIANAAGGWVNTGFAPGKFSPYYRHFLNYNYAFDKLRNVGSLVSLTIDSSQAMVIPSSLQNVAAQESDWADSCSMQVQLDLGSQGGSFGHSLQNIEYRWS